MAATTTIIEAQNDQCSSKYSSSPSFRVLRPGRERSSTSSTMLQDNGRGQGENYREKQVDDSLQKIMFLNCWSQS